MSRRARPRPFVVVIAGRRTRPWPPTLTFSSRCRTTIVIIFRRRPWSRAIIVVIAISRRPWPWTIVVVVIVIRRPRSRWTRPRAGLWRPAFCR